MTLLGVFVVIWGALIGAAYFAGLALEAMWGSHVSLLAFLVMFFGSIVLAWLVAVRLTAPSATAVQADGAQRAAL